MKFTLFKVFGLGAFFELERVAHEETWKDRIALIGKIVIGPVLINFQIPLGSWRPSEPPF